MLATTEKNTASRLFEHLKSAPGACNEEGDTGAWLEELKRQVEGGDVAYLGMPLVATGNRYERAQ